MYAIVPEENQILNRCQIEAAGSSVNLAESEEKSGELESTKIRDMKKRYENRKRAML